MNGGSSVSYLTCAPLSIPSLIICLEADRLLDFQGRAGITSIVRWNLSSGYIRCRISLENREGANREKLTVKKIINKEMFFFHRLCPLQTVKNRRKP